MNQAANQTPDLSRTPPNDRDAEQAVIGSCWLMQSAIDSVSPIVTGDDFYMVAEHPQIRVQRRQVSVRLGYVRLDAGEHRRQIPPFLSVLVVDDSDNEFFDKR